jgi:hypothetical protein
MLQTSLKFSFIGIALAGLLFTTSCNRKDKDKDYDTEFAKDNASMEAIYNEVMDMADDASEKSTGDHLSQYKTSSACAIITHDTLSMPRLITIDFGPVNCLCSDGRNRRGKILISYTGAYRDSGMVRTISFDQYAVNDRQILGNKTITNLGPNSAGQTHFAILLNGLMIKPSGDSMTRVANRIRTWVQGDTTMTRMDDVYEITGSTSGTNSFGSYTMIITQPLVKAIACDWISAGEFELQPSGRQMRTMNFGTGTCDNQATVTIGGVSYPVTLP